MGTYVVRKGDTFAEIAQRFAIPVERLAALNRIPDPDRVYVGRALEVPERAARGLDVPERAGGAAEVSAARDAVRRPRGRTRRRYRVDSDIGVNVRAEPNGARVGGLPNGAVVVARRREPVSAGGHTWLKVRAEETGLVGWVALEFLEELPDEEPVTGGTNGDLRERVLARAAARRGIPYQLPPDEINHTTLDCSLYVKLTFRDAGAPFPPGVRTAEQLRQACTPIADTDARPGDLLFFHNTASHPPGVASHVGISLGAGTGRMWECHAREGNSGPPGVGEIPITQWWLDHWLEARRPRQLG